VYYRLQAVVDQWKEFERGMKSLEAWIPSSLDRVQKLTMFDLLATESAEQIAKKSALLLVSICCSSLIA